MASSSSAASVFEDNRNSGLVFCENAPRHMLITGFGRGGTTACAMMLEALGFTLEANTPTKESTELRQVVLDRDNDAALAHVAKWPAVGPRMVWKDPKLFSLLTFLKQMPSDIGMMFVFRDPLKVAIRNEKGGGIAGELERVAKRLRRISATISSLPGRKMILVSYESLLVERERTVKKIANHLGINDETTIKRAVNVIEPSPEGYRRLIANRKN